MKRGSGCCAVGIYCTAALTSFSNTISYITCLFWEWHIKAISGAELKLFFIDTFILGHPVELGDVNRHAVLPKVSSALRGFFLNERIGKELWFFKPRLRAVPSDHLRPLFVFSKEPIGRVQNCISSYSSF